MKLSPSSRRKSARALIIKDKKLLVFLRKRFSKVTGKWIEYYSIPGGGIEIGETPKDAAVRELYEEMGVRIEVGDLVAHMVGERYEHYVYTATIKEGVPTFMNDSEEAAAADEHNQFIVHWADIETITAAKLRYYGVYYELIKDLGKGVSTPGLTTKE